MRVGNSQNHAASACSEIQHEKLEFHLISGGSTSFIIENNNILLKNLGNYVSRVVKFINSKNFNGVVPDYTKYQDTAFDAWKDEINQLLTRYIKELDAVKLRAA